MLFNALCPVVICEQKKQDSAAHVSLKLFCSQQVSHIKWERGYLQVCQPYAYLSSGLQTKHGENWLREKKNKGCKKEKKKKRKEYWTYNVNLMFN